MTITENHHHETITRETALAVVAHHFAAWKKEQASVEIDIRVHRRIKDDATVARLIERLKQCEIALEELAQIQREYSVEKR